MAESSIPVDLYSAGQVFACLGFLEVSDVLCCNAEGRFDWSDDVNVRFCLRTNGNKNPFATVLGFLAGVELTAVAPRGWRPKKDPSKEEEPQNHTRRKKWKTAKQKVEDENRRLARCDAFPASLPDTSSAMPVRIAGPTTKGKRIHVVLSHWADGSSRNEFKLYAGNRPALDIAKAMLTGTFAKPRKGQNIGDLKTKGLRQLWEEHRSALTEKPFDITTSMGGSFNFDPRGAWTAIDAGYSPNDQKHQVTASPVVEILAAWGLENARPEEFSTRKVRYSAWGRYLPPMLARVALFAGIPVVPMKHFRLNLDLAGKNKVVTYAEEEITHA